MWKTMREPIVAKGVRLKIAKKEWWIHCMEVKKTE
jgi:hypothetical protein